MKNLFPLKFEVTQEIIDKGLENIFSTNNCIGALSLKEALKNSKDSYQIAWAVKDGDILSDNNHLKITTVENINFMALRKPQEVTFIIKKHIYETYYLFNNYKFTKL